MSSTSEARRGAAIAVKSKRITIKHQREKLGVRSIRKYDFRGPKVGDGEIAR
jgi:hypothetical protein